MNEPKKHPSFGVIGISRIHGERGGFFGSHVKKHHDFISLRISNASYRHELGKDWIRADGMLPIIEVELTPAQFAAMLTTMNVGDGVPCTIKFRDGKPTEPVPDDYGAEHERVVEEFRQKIEAKRAEVQPRLARVRELLTKKGTLRVAEKEEILDLVEGLFRDFSRGNADFILEQFERSAEKVVTEAKALVDEFITSTAARLGMKALKERFSAAPMLGDGEEP